MIKTPNDTYIDVIGETYYVYKHALDRNYYVVYFGKSLTTLAFLYSIAEKDIPTNTPLSSLSEVQVQAIMEYILNE